MSNQQQKQQEYGREMWDNYIDSLEEENIEQAKEKTSSPKIQISKMTEQDLMDYRRHAFPGKKKGLKILAIGSIVTLLAMTSALVFQSSRSYNEYYPTEQNYIEAVPVEIYEEPWMDEMDLSTPTFYLEGHQYSLPETFGNFLVNDNTYSSSAFGEQVKEVGEDPVIVELKSYYGRRIAEVMLVSPTGETVPIEEALVVGLDIDGSDTDFSMGPIGSYSSKYSIGTDLSSMGVEYNYSQDKKVGLDNYTISRDFEEKDGYNHYDLTIHTHDTIPNRFTIKVDKK